MHDGGSRNGLSLSEEAQFGGPMGWAPLLGTLDQRKALDMGISTHRGSVGEPERNSLAGTFDRKG